jgi:hypothetical protein
VGKQMNWWNQMKEVEMNGKLFTRYVLLVKIRDYAGIQRVRCILKNERLIISRLFLINKIINSITRI